MSYTRRAIRNLESIKAYYAKYDEETGLRAVNAIVESLKKLSLHPLTGRPVPDSKRLREKVIAFGGQGFLALYEVYAATDTLIVSAIRHQRQLSYKKED